MPLARFERATLNLGGSCSVQSELQGLIEDYSTPRVTEQPPWRADGGHLTSPLRHRGTLLSHGPLRPSVG